MGVTGLGKFLNKYCKESIRVKSLYFYKNKKIVIDINNYLYRFLKKGTLIQSLYEFCQLFKYYNIEPIFVFDGIPPEEKMDMILQRQETRSNANKRYEELIAEYEKTKNEDLMKEIKSTKIKTLKLTNNDFRNTKTLLSLLKLKFIIADGEADKLCASMVIYNEVYACMTEDNDLFTYGCPRIIRSINMFDHTVIEYELKSILKIIGVSNEDFKYLCILNGTEHNNIICNSKTLNESFEFYYENYKNSHHKTVISFIKNKISNSNIDKINFIKNIFTLLKKENYNYKDYSTHEHTLETYLKPFNFIFI